MQAWRSGAKTDRYMAGVIRADGRGEGRGRECECGGIYVRRPIPGFRNEIPNCILCSGFPRQFVVRIDLPGIPKKDLRHSKEGERLESPSAADELLERIRKEVKAGTINLMDYLPKSRRNELIFHRFAERYVKARKRDPERPLTPKAEHSIRTSLRNYLAPSKAILASRPRDEDGLMIGHPGFTDVPIDQITTGMIKRFKAEWAPVANAKRKAKTTRSRDVALETLQAILNYAYDQEFIQVVPRFPERKRSDEATARIPAHVQDGALSLMSDPWRAALEVMRILLCRQSEIRALREKDIDRGRSGVWIRRHFSGSEEIAGRKSVRDPKARGFEHFVPVGEEFFAILNRLPRSLNPEAYLFHEGDSNQALGENSFNTEWRSALAKYNAAHKTDFDADSYRGIKSSTITICEDAGVDLGTLSKRAGHASPRMTQRYGSRSAEPSRGVVEGVLIQMRQRKAEQV